MSKYIRKAQGLYIDGKEKIGSMTEYTPPVLEEITDDFRAGGMPVAVPVSLGLNPLSASISVTEDPEILTLFGVKRNHHLAVFVRALIEDDETGDKKEVVEELRGKFTKVDRGTLNTGNINGTTMEMKLSYYKYEIDGKTITEIDPKNMVWIQDGEDMWADERAALGK